MKALWKKRVHFVGQSYNSKKLTVKGIHLFTLLCWSLLVLVLFSENISEACSVENFSGVACTVGRVVSGTIESSGTFKLAAGVVGSSGHLNSYKTINRSFFAKPMQEYESLSSEQIHTVTSNTNLTSSKRFKNYWKKDIHCRKKGWSQQAFFFTFVQH